MSLPGPGRDLLSGRPLTCTDINPALLATLLTRTNRCGLEISLVVDDIEKPALAPVFDTVVAVLVLEHVDWRKAVRSLAGLGARRIHVVIQRNPPSLETAITMTRRLNKTIAEFARMANPGLLDEPELVSEFENSGYQLRCVRERPVADGKVMVGISFAPRAIQPA